MTPFFGVALACLNDLVRVRSASLFCEGNVAEARFTLCFTQYWTRGLVKKVGIPLSVKSFKKKLKWDDYQDSEFIDRCAFPLLAYAVAANNSHLVREIIESLNSSKTLLDRYLIKARLPKIGIPNLSITGHMSPLMGAMAVASPDIVSMLLKHGADPRATDINGNDALTFASVFGNFETSR